MYIIGIGRGYPLYSLFRIVLIVLAFVLVLPDSSQARSFALLVGVSDYDEGSGASDLRGPANDVRLLGDVLKRRSAFEITILADGVDGALRPTRDAILSHLDALVAAVESGDFVYLHFSGHGTQQADQNGDETDGVDEVFLPADTARAEPGSGVIPNAIIDEELGARVAAMRAKGADVWFVLDACHSGSGLRSGSPRVASRFVDPAALGINVTPSAQPATTATLEAVGDVNLPGGYLAFYSAQSSEVAREIQVDEADAGSWYGLFTSRLAVRLQPETALSYRQLFQAVLADLNDESVPGGARLQTPLWEGNLIDAPVFGGGDVVGVRQFAVDGNRIRAGKLQGISNNTLVALVSDAAADAEDILGFAQVEGADATSGKLAAVDGNCSASVDAPCKRSGQLPTDARFARVAAKPLDRVLRIAPPYELTTGQALAESDPLFKALSDAIAVSNAESGTKIEMDPNGLILSGASSGALWFGHRISIGSTPTGLRWHPDNGPLEPLLLRMAKAEELANMLASVAGTPSLLFPSPIEISVELRVADPSAIAPDVPADLIEECMSASRSAEVASELPSGAALKQCDYLAFGAKGVVQGPARDVNRIYIDSQFCATAEYRRVEGVSLPAIVGDPFSICSDCPGLDGVSFSAGAERMFFVVTEAEANREALNLTGLVDTCGPSVADTRSASSPRVDSFLTGLSQQTATRSRMGAVGISKIWVEEFNWQVLPRREARAQSGLATNN